MPVIKAELNTQEFLKFYSDDCNVKKFSRGAVVVILQRIADFQSTEPENVRGYDWRSFFAELVEHSAEMLVNNEHFGAKRHASAILDMMTQYENLNDDLIKIIGDPNIGSDETILAAAWSELIKIEGWYESAADVIATIMNYERLPNDHYLVSM